MMFADDGEMLLECVFFLLSLFSVPNFSAILAVTLRMSSGKISSVYENSALIVNTA